MHFAGLQKLPDLQSPRPSSGLGSKCVLSRQRGSRVCRVSKRSEVFYNMQDKDWSWPFHVLGISRSVTGQHLGKFTLDFKCHFRFKLDDIVLLTSDTQGIPYNISLNLWSEAMYSVFMGSCYTYSNTLSRSLSMVAKLMYTNQK